MPPGDDRSRPGPTRRAATRTVTALVRTGVLDRSRDAAAIDRLQALAGAVDEVKTTGDQVPCPHCEQLVPIGPRTVDLVRLSRELRAWWEAIRARKEATQGVSISDLFADLDAQLRTGPAQPDR